MERLTFLKRIAALFSALIVVVDGEIAPGVNGPVEAQTKTVQIGEGNTTATVSFTLEAGFKNAPHVSTSAGISAQSGGSSSSKVNRHEVDYDGTYTADQVDVVVELDAAPGAGETTDVDVGITAAGEQA